MSGVDFQIFVLTRDSVFKTCVLDRDRVGQVNVMTYRSYDDPKNNVPANTLSEKSKICIWECSTKTISEY